MSHVQVTPKATGFHNLGLELLAQVLEHVPQDYRLYDCAVVCKTWRQAANMATSTASSTLRCCTDQEGLNSLTAWLRRNSRTGKLSSITVGTTSECDVKPILKLPAKVLGQLQQLSLSSCALKVSRVMPNSSALAATAPFTASAAASMVPAVTSTAESAVSPATSALSALQSLYLHSVQLDLSDFGSCTGLQCLWAYDVSHIAEQRPASGSAESTEMKNGVDVHAAAEERTRTYGVNHLAPQLMNALPYLTRLTSLTLEGRYDVHRCQQTHSENSANSSTATVSLSSLRPLRSMHLSGLNIAALGFTQLPLNLTSLQIFRSSSVTRWTMPELQELTKLQYLRITAVQQVDAVLLSRLVQLTELDLSNTRFSRNFAVDELFQAIRQMEQLQDLRLTSSLAAEPSHPELYAALTASRRLQWLDITRCKIAAKAVGYVFPETCPVNSLRYVAANAELFLSTGSFEKLTSCCPGLQQLEIDDRSMCTQRVSHPDWKGLHDLSSLTLLEGLTCLQLSNIYLPMDALQSIAACTQLRVLRLETRGSWTPADKAFESMMQLTRLTELRDLTMIVTVKKNRHKLYMVHDHVGSAPLYQRLQEAIDKRREQPSTTPMAWDDMHLSNSE